MNAMRRYFICLFALITIHSNVHGSPRFNIFTHLLRVSCIACRQIDTDTLLQLNRNHINNFTIDAGIQQLSLKEASTFQTLASNINRSLSVPKKSLYFMFSISAARFPLRNLNMYPAVKFNYNYKNDQQNSYKYADSVHVKPLSNFSGIGFGLEIGSRKGIFFAANAGSMLGGSSVDFASVQSGYNIVLPIKRFSIQPSLSYANITERTELSEIPFNAKDIVAFGTTFPYKPCPCGKSSYMLIKSTQHMNFIQSKITLNYAVSKYLTLKFGYSFWSQVRNSTKLYLESNSKSKTIRNEVYHAVDANQADTSYHRTISFFWETSALFIFKSNPHRGTRGRSYYHSYGGSHFSSGSSHFCH
jgi:hypothetical protein